MKHMLMETRPMTSAAQRKWIIMGCAVAALAVVAWYLFRPELLFVNQRVSEEFPAATNGAAASTSGQVELASEMFHSIAHQTKGTATIHRLVDGQRVLRLSGFQTSSGPALHVYLVAAPNATDNETVTKAGFVDLGALKGNIGDQNYAIPADVDLSKYQAVTIWCQRFGVNFATAPLSAN
jgi:hypothetical protein